MAASFADNRLAPNNDIQKPLRLTQRLSKRQVNCVGVATKTSFKRGNIFGKRGRPKGGVSYNRIEKLCRYIARPAVHSCIERNFLCEEIGANANGIWMRFVARDTSP